MTLRERVDADLKEAMRAKVELAVATKCLRLGLYAIVLFSPSTHPLRGQDMAKPSRSRASVDERCVNNLQRIGELVDIHIHGSRGLPLEAGLTNSNLSSLLYLMCRDPKPFICPADKHIEPPVDRDHIRTSYEVVNNPLNPKLSRLSVDRIAIIAEKRANHDGKRFVLFYDGSVRAFNTSQFDRLKNKSFIASAQGKKYTRKIDTFLEPPPRKR